MAWANMAIPACCITWAFVSAAVSTAKSASMIRALAADMFSEVLIRLAMVDSKRFWIAPRPPRMVEISSKAASTLAMAIWESSSVATDRSAAVTVSLISA